MSGYRLRSRLREVLEERAWTRQDLAETTDLPYATVRRLVKGIGDPPLDQVLVICEALSLEVEDLYWLEEDEAEAPVASAVGGEQGSTGTTADTEAGPGTGTDVPPSRPDRAGPRAAPRRGASPRARRGA